MPLLNYIIKKQDTYALEEFNCTEEIDICRQRILEMGGFLPPTKAGWKLTSYPDPPNGKITLKWFTNYGYRDSHLKDNHLRVYLNLFQPNNRQTIYIKSYDGVVNFADLVPYFNKFFNPTPDLVQELYDIALQKLACYRNVNLNGNQLVIDQYNSTFVGMMEARHDLDKDRLDFLWKANRLKTSLDLYQVESKLAELQLLEDKKREILAKLMEAFE